MNSQKSRTEPQGIHSFIKGPRDNHLCVKPMLTLVQDKPGTFPPALILSSNPSLAESRLTLQERRKEERRLGL